MFVAVWRAGISSEDIITLGDKDSVFVAVLCRHFF